jgi:hypothetical protein
VELYSRHFVGFFALVSLKVLLPRPVMWLK